MIRMKSFPFLLLLTALLAGAQAQIAPDKYYVQFTDKNNSPYSIDNPQEYLSQRAIERRGRQNIPIDLYDIPVNPSYVQGVGATGATILNKTKWFNGVTIYTEDPAVLEAIGNLPYVAWVTAPDASAPMSSIKEDDLQKSFFLWENYRQDAPAYLKNTGSASDFNYGLSLNQIQMLNGDQFHGMGYRGQGMVIAVLDAGFTNADSHDAFDSLWFNNQILGTRDFVRGGESTFDEHPHGTMVLSTMGANYPGQLIGTAPKASYWLLRSEDGASEYIIEEYNWVSAAEFADSAGVDIINSSLGYTEFNDPSQNHTYADMDGDSTPITRGADFAASRGILVVNSLGNEGGSAWYYLSAPSDGDSVMGIGAVDANGFIAGFSSHGPSYDGRVKPNVVTQGSGVYVADAFSVNSYTFSGGTSFSSPILAGMAACLWQANPLLTNMQIKHAIEESASQYQAPDASMGHGIPDFVMANNILTVIDSPTENLIVSELFPNPASEQFYLRLHSASEGQGRAVVTDMSGRFLYSREFQVSPGDLVQLPVMGTLTPGIYLVWLQFNGSQAHHKLIVR